MSLLLEVKNISRNFGGLAALSGVSFGVSPGEIVGVIGPNGAGKTTLFNVITGFCPPKEGQIIFDGEDITKLKPHQVSRRRIIRTFQAHILFREFSVQQNVLAGLHIRSLGLNPRHIFFSPSLIPESETRMASEILETIGLTQFKDYLAGELSHGHQRMLGIGVALAAEPKLLLLDEPVTGMNSDEIRAVIELIHTLRGKGLTILIVEHHIKTVMDICQRVIVLNFGKKIAEGSPEEVRRNKDVVEAYLGPESA
ncbi:MAG: ABC transporter ATP-binding protein [Desulfobacteraceae bacterium]|nr:ABC transporter ATP-binding protein [Desulfobacteraceae bacterium]